MSDISPNSAKSASAFLRDGETRRWLASAGVITLGLIVGGYLLGNGLVRTAEQWFGNGARAGRARCHGRPGHLVVDRPAPFGVVSTGTWVVVMAVGGRAVTLDPARDTLVNVNAMGGLVNSARFMGGREYEIIRAGRAPSATTSTPTACWMSA